MNIVMIRWSLFVFIIFEGGHSLARGGHSNFAEKEGAHWRGVVIEVGAH